MSNTRAILLMVGSMLCFTGVDAFVKLASRTQSAAQIVALTSLATLVIFLVPMWRTGERMFTRQALHPAMVVRSVGEVLGSFGVVMALGLVPLATVTVVGQAMPLAIVLGAALFLKEQVGWRRWVAVALGFIGVMIILRPGAVAFDPNVLWVLLYVVGLAARDLASRQLPRTVSTPFAVAWSMVGLTAFGLALMPFQGGWHPIDGQTALWLAGIIVSSSVALALITLAYRTGEVSAVAPFRYSRIVFSLTLAFVVFGEQLDVMTWIGSALIVGSGLYSFWRERQRALALRRA